MICIKCEKERKPKISLTDQRECDCPAYEKKIFLSKQDFEWYKYTMKSIELNIQKLKKFAL